MSELAITFKVPCILVHGDVDNPTQDSKDLVVGLKALLELDILIPKGMCEEVKSNALRTSFEESMKVSESVQCHEIGGVEWNGECYKGKWKMARMANMSS